jgi:hypothetical protein
MLKAALCAVWVCAVTLGSSVAASYWMAGRAGADTHAEEGGGLEYKKTRSIDVPMIADGALQGYVVAQFVFTADTRMEKELPVPPEMFLLDEAFRTLYSDDKLDFRHLERYDLAKLTKGLAERVNQRAKMAVVKDVLVEEFNYVTRSDMRR